MTQDAIADALALADGTYPVAGAHQGPLAGVRAIVLTQAWAGTFCTELLGLMGAEVIQIDREAERRAEAARREQEAKIAAATRTLERARAAESQARRALARAEEEVRAAEAALERAKG